MAELSETQRQVVLLIELEGMRYDQAAAILGIPVGTVRSRLGRARNMLRRLLDRETETGISAPPHPLRNKSTGTAALHG